MFESFRGMWNVDWPEWWLNKAHGKSCDQKCN